MKPKKKKEETAPAPVPSSLADQLLKSLVAGEKDFDLTKFYAEVRKVVALKMAPLGWPDADLEGQLAIYKHESEAVIGAPAKKASEVFTALNLAEIMGDQYHAAGLVLRVWSFLQSVERKDKTRTPPLYETAKRIYAKELQRLRANPALAVPEPATIAYSPAAISFRRKQREAKVRSVKKKAVHKLIKAKRMRELLEAENYSVGKSFEVQWSTWLKRIHFETCRELI